MIQGIASRIIQPPVVSIAQGFAMLLMAPRWMLEVGSPDKTQAFPPLEHLTAPIAELFRQYSKTGPIVYIEIDEQLGLTWQAAVGWSAARLALPLSVLNPGEGRPPGGGPVVEAFAFLGAEVDPDHSDFGDFGLYRFKHMNQWISFARSSAGDVA